MVLRGVGREGKTTLAGEAGVLAGQPPALSGGRCASNLHVEATRCRVLPLLLPEETEIVLPYCVPGLDRSRRASWNFSINHSRGTEAGVVAP